MSLAATLAACVVVLCCAANPAGPPRPHIVMLVVDDLGYKNLHAPPYFVNGELRTPALARMAREGVVLSNYYAYRVCGPSRASLLTGRLPGHGISEEMFSPSRAEGYNANLTMLPAKLRQAGYKTHALGKWHCGFWQRQFLPTSRGFDTYTGYLSGAEDHYDQTNADECNGKWFKGTDLWQDLGVGSSSHRGSPAYGLNGTYSSYTYTRLAVEIIENHGRRYEGASNPAPLFLYFALHNVHGPAQAEDRFLRLYNDSIDHRRRTLNAMVSTVDETVANVTLALSAANMFDDTMIILVSDNGGPIMEPTGRASPGNNHPLRAGKYSWYEGGIRVVGMVQYPRLLRGREGRVWDGLMHASDWYATLCGLAGADARDTGEGRVPIDGIDVWQALSSGSPSPRQELVLGIADTGAEGSYRKGSMKLIVGKIRVTAWVGNRYPNLSTPVAFHLTPKYCDPGCLYNLSADPTEDHDLWHVLPNIATAMLGRYKVLAKELSAPNDDPRHVPATREGGAPTASHSTDPRGCAAMMAAGGWWVPWGDDEVEVETTVQV